MSLASLSRELTVGSAVAAPPRDIDSSAAPAPSAGSAPAPILEMLTRYIPTETITLYVGAMAARQEIAEALGLDVWAIYTTFAVLTPLLLLLMLLGKHRAANGASTFTFAWWPLAAATIAFLVWALSVPGHPAADEWTALPAFGALLVSTMLALLDPIFLPKRE